MTTRLYPKSGYPKDSAGTCWQLTGWPSGTTEADAGLHTGDWVRPVFWTPNRSYTQVFEYAQALGSPTKATCMRLDLRSGLHTGVWIPNRGYPQLFGFPDGAYTQVLGFPIGATCRCMESQMVDPASCQNMLALAK